jgi:hypothetical protein
MPVPVWIVAIRDPAYAYMLRSSGVRRPRAPLRRRRAARISIGYAPLGAPIPQPTHDEIQQLRSQADAANRVFMARVRDVENRHGEVVRRTAEDLMRVGTATLRTSAGDIQARIIRFRKEAVVLEIQYPGGWSQGRSSLSTVGETSVHALTNALASTRPEAEPLP